MDKKKILVPVDFTDCSQNALKIASGIAKSTGSWLTLLHTYDVPNVYGLGEINGTPLPVLLNQDRFARDFREDIRKSMMEMIRKANLQDWDWNGHLILKEGQPKQVILQKIKGQRIGLTVMGTNGADIERGVLGVSTTYEVSKDADCPVMVIPSRKINRINNIVYATDLKHFERTALAKLAEVAQFYDAKITLLHVMNQSEDEDEKRQELKQMLSMVPLPEKFKDFELLKGYDPIISLSSYAENHEVGLISMTTHTHSLFQRLFRTSFTRFMVLYSEFPLLVFNENNAGPLRQPYLLSEDVLHTHSLAN